MVLGKPSERDCSPKVENHCLKARRFLLKQMTFKKKKSKRYSFEKAFSPSFQWKKPRGKKPQ